MTDIGLESKADGNEHPSDDPKPEAFIKAAFNKFSKSSSSKGNADTKTGDAGKDTESFSSVSEAIAGAQYLKKQEYFQKLDNDKKQRKESALSMRPGSNKSKLALLANTIAGALTCKLEDVWRDAKYDAENTTSVSATILMQLGDIETALDSAWKQYITSVYASLISEAFVWIEINCMKQHTVARCTMGTILRLDESGQTLFGNLCRTLWVDRAQKGGKHWARIRGWETVDDEFKQLKKCLSPYFAR